MPILYFNRLPSVPLQFDDSFPEQAYQQPLLSVRTAREAAYVAIEEYLNTGTWVSDVLDRVFKTGSLPPIERGLAMELACGVVRRLATLDSILSQLVARPLEKVEPPLLSILRLGIYQLALLDGVPPHAALHETVELTKRLGRHQWSGFVNGVLRGGTRCITNEFDTKASSRGVPVSDGRYRRLVEPAFADPTSNPIGYVADAFSFPLWLVERWASRMKPPDLFRLGAWFNTTGRLHLRANQLRTTRDDLMAALTDAGIAAQPVGDAGSVALEESCAVDRLPGYAEGLFAVQDLSASRAAMRLAPQPGQRVWDVCAAPGGKTCHLAELMQNSGEIIATDIRPERLALVEENRQRLGASIITTRLIGEDGSQQPEGPFDAILVDVPCSNTGVIRRRVDVRWRLQPSDIDDLTVIQSEILANALPCLKSGGRIVYSTCSIEDAENIDLVKAFAETHGLRVEKSVRIIPTEHGTDGAFAAVLRVR